LRQHGNEHSWNVAAGPSWDEVQQEKESKDIINEVIVWQKSL
jgi:hypothetical protein